MHYFGDIWFQGDDGRFEVDYRGGRMRGRSDSGTRPRLRAKMHVGVHGAIALALPCCLCCWRTYTTRRRHTRRHGTLCSHSHCEIPAAPRTIRDSWQIAKDSAGGGLWQMGGAGSRTKQCNKWTSYGEWQICEHFCILNTANIDQFNRPTRTTERRKERIIGRTRRSLGRPAVGA